MKRWSISILILLIAFAGGTVFIGSWLHGQNPPPTVLPREVGSYREVVKRVLPAVVSIETRGKNKAPARPNLFPFDDPNLPEEFRRAPVPPIDPNRLGFGSGFFVDPTGVVVTNYHVVEGADTATVHLLDGRKFTSKNIRTDQRTDLAVILLDVKDGRFPILEMGDSDAMEIGDRVLAVGAPFGLAGSVTHGIISAKGRNGLRMSMYEDYLQTDAAINPGNSGGPLVNLEGKVIGINAAIKSKSGGFQGVGLAVASNLGKNVILSLRTTGKVDRGYLGAHIRELDADVAARFDLPKETGVVVADVFPDTPAAKGGLQPGDVIFAIAGKMVRDGRALQLIVASSPINQAAAVDVVRDGKKERLHVTIEPQPTEYGTAGVPAPRNAAPAPAAVALPTLGIDAADLTDELAEDLGYRKGVRGILITRIHESGPAALSGLKARSIISRIDAQRITSIATARQALESAKLDRGVLLQVVTPQGGANYVLVRSGS